MTSRHCLSRAPIAAAYIEEPARSRKLIGCINLNCTQAGSTARRADQTPRRTPVSREAKGSRPGQDALQNARTSLVVGVGGDAIILLRLHGIPSVVREQAALDELRQDSLHVRRPRVPAHCLLASRLAEPLAQLGVLGEPQDGLPRRRGRRGASQAVFPWVRIVPIWSRSLATIPFPMAMYRRAWSGAEEGGPSGSPTCGEARDRRPPGIPGRRPAPPSP